MVRKVKKRPFHKRYYALAGIITLLVFVTGILTGMLLESEKISYLEQKLRELEISKSDGEIQNLLATFLELDTCRVFKYEVEKIIPEISRFGEELEIYERTRKIESSKYEELKKEYTLMNIKYYLFVEGLRKRCNYTYVPILYFYSNEKCEDCEVQGYVLRNLKRKAPKKYMIFAIDGDMDLESVKLLKKIYNITSYPSLVIYEKVYEGFLPMKKIEEIAELRG